MLHNRVPILANAYEQVVDGQLGALCERYGARLFPKVGLKDVLPVRAGNLDAADRNYAFMAHFDFVITDESSEALIAVEFDGPHHLTDPQQVIRDERKNRICNEFMLPLARAGAAALRRADHRTLLQWLIEVFFEQRRLWAQQQSHEEEECEEPPEIDPKDFDYRQSAPGVRGLWLWGPLDAFGEARAKVGEFYWQQAIHPGYEGWTGKDPRGHHVGHLALEVGDDEWLVGTGRCDLRGVEIWLDAMFPPELAQDLALLSLARQLDEWQRGRLHPISRHGRDRRVAGAEEMLWSLLPEPNASERSEAMLRTLAGWGVDTENPLVLADVWESVPADGETHEDYQERMNERLRREEMLEVAREFDEEFGTETSAMFLTRCLRRPRARA